MNKREIMKKAVALAKTFVGDWAARMALALRKVWAAVKVQIKKNMATEKQRNYLNALVKNFDRKAYFHNENMDTWTAERVLTRMIKKASDKYLTKKDASQCIEFFVKYQVRKEKATQKYIRAKYAGYCAETGVRFEKGALIFYCPVAGGYVLAENY